MSLASGDLTTLAAVKSYMTAPPSDAVLSGLVTRISRVVLSAINRPLLVPKTYTQKFNGTGTTALVLPYWPVLELTSLALDGASISEAPQLSDSTSISLGYGWRFQTWNGLPPGDPANVELVGCFFPRGNQNIVATYEAGYKISDESQTVPASTAFTITPDAPYGIWATDEGVTYDDGTAFTAIASGTPTEGQYLPPDPEADTPRTYYTFSSSDASQGVLLSYGFIPADVEQIAIELITERSVYRNRVGIRSQSLASQEMISYDNSGLTRFIQNALEPYVSVLPPPLGGNV